MVSRSSSALGPFEGSRVILQASEAWIAPGHNSVVTDDEGNDWIVYHALAPRDADAGATEPRIMLMDRLEQRDGWPAVEARQPSAGPMPAPRLAAH
jgi:arabinan endo-1,5-alpha-L-arabinosidase